MTKKTLERLSRVACSKYAAQNISVIQDRYMLTVQNLKIFLEKHICIFIKPTKKWKNSTANGI